MAGPRRNRHRIELAYNWFSVASGMTNAAVTTHNRNAALHVGRLGVGANVELPQALYLHLFVAWGDVTL